MQELTLDNIKEKYHWAYIEYNTQTKEYKCYNYFGRYLFSYNTLDDVDKQLYSYITNIANKK